MKIKQPTPQTDIYYHRLSEDLHGNLETRLAKSKPKTNQERKLINRLEAHLSERMDKIASGEIKL